MVETGKVPQILILEDDAEFGPLLKYSLEDEGYAVSLHTNAQTALKHADENHVDLVISDLLIEENGKPSPHGGVTLISALKQIRDHPAPVIAISGAFTRDKYHAISTAMTVGADRTLAKPVSPHELLALIRQLL